MSEIKGKIQKIDLNNTGTKKDGTSFTNIKIRIEGHEDVITISKSSPAGKFAEKLDLKVGDEVTIVKGGQYNSVQKIMKGGGYVKSSNGKSFAGKSTYNSDGARSGMIVGKAVELYLAIAKSNNADLTKTQISVKDGLKAAAQDIIELTKFVEESVKNAPKSDVNPYEKTKDTVKPTEDFADSDEDF